MEVENIKFNKLFILLLLVVAFISFGAAFALDENATDLSIDVSDDEAIEVCDSQEVLRTGGEDSLSVDYSDVSNSSTIKIGKVTKRYNNAVEYSATFFDENGTPLKDTIVYCGVDSVIYGVNATTNSNGVALFLLPLDKGVHNLYLMNTVGLGINNDTIKVFDVLTGNRDYNLYFNSGKSYSVRVFGDDGKPVGANKKVTFTVNFKKHVVKTDKMVMQNLKSVSSLEAIW